MSFTTSTDVTQEDVMPELNDSYWCDERSSSTSETTSQIAICITMHGTQARNSCQQEIEKWPWVIGSWADCDPQAEKKNFFRHISSFPGKEQKLQTTHDMAVMMRENLTDLMFTPTPNT